MHAQTNDDDPASITTQSWPQFNSSTEYIQLLLLGYPTQHPSVAGTTNEMKVILLIESQEQQMGANEVCQLLSSKFSVKHVSVRSARVPLDRFLATDAPMLFVHLTTGSTHAGTAFTALETPAPVLTIPFSGSSSNNNNNNEATALAIAKHCGLASETTRRCIQQAMQVARLSHLAMDAQYNTQSPYYLDTIATCFDTHQQIVTTNNPTVSGKVRDTYVGPTTLALVTTDRQSGFDRQLAVVPFKGAVLNLTAAFWCDCTKDIIGNHLIHVPHPNVSIVKKCTPFPIEFVVRAYLTGSTDTSIWKHYQAGSRDYCGYTLKDDMVKNQSLPGGAILTPTTKEEHHDRPISPKDVVEEGWMTQQDFDICHEAALKLFARGQEVALSHGLLLVDTKYEFGKHVNDSDSVSLGEILLIDEIHTPDSSRYWLASTYEERLLAGLEPENIDKEFLRLWFRDNCDPYDADAVLPEAPRELVLELARRYITLYEMITGKDFDFEAVTGKEDIANVIETYLK